MSSKKNYKKKKNSTNKEINAKNNNNPKITEIENIKENNPILKKEIDIPKKKRKRKRRRKKNKKKTLNENIINLNTQNKQKNNSNKTKNTTKKEIKKTQKDNNTKIDISKKKTKKKKKKYGCIITIIISGLILIMFIALFYINKNINITLNGDTTETIEVFSEYNDPGFTALLFKHNINEHIETISNLNTTKLGTYTITYKLPFLNTHQITRTINVVDTTKPTITLNGDTSITMYVDDEYTEKGVTIEDNYDKDLSNNLSIESNLDTNTAGTYTITYTVKDSSNNENNITRTIIVKKKSTYTKTCNTTNSISKYICENNYNVSVGYYNLTNNQTYYYNKYEQYYGASLIKTLDALYLYDKNIINDELKEHVKKIITVSDNPSHQYLVNYIGKDNLKAYGNSLGATYTLIGGDNYGITTVSDQIVYMKKLYSMTKDNQNEELKSFFINTYYNNLLFEGSPTIMHKYGWWEQVFHNSGIVLDDNPYIVTILTKEGYDDYKNIIRNISKLVYEYHKQQTY